jgi:hypothetical protein
MATEASTVPTAISSPGQPPVLSWPLFSSVAALLGWLWPLCHWTCLHQQLFSSFLGVTSSVRKTTEEKYLDLIFQYQGRSTGGCLLAVHQMSQAAWLCSQKRNVTWVPV